MKKSTSATRNSSAIALTPISGGKAPATRVRACYPFVRITTATHARLDSRLAYGFVAGPGVHETSVTRPDIFRTYFTEQIGS